MHSCLLSEETSCGLTLVNDCLPGQMNPLVIAATGIQFKSAFHACVISFEFFMITSGCIQSDCNKIYEWIKLLLKKFHDYLTCEFTAIIDTGVQR